MVVFFLLIEVLLTRLTVSCDNWNELTCWISTAIRQPLSCLPSVPRRPRTYDPSRQLRRGYPVGLKTLMHTRLLRFQAGSSGSLARKWPSRCGGGGGCPCRVHRAVRRLPARTHGGLGCSQGTLKSPRYYIVITVHSLEPASRWQGRLTDFILCPINTDPS